MRLVPALIVLMVSASGLFAQGMAGREFDARALPQGEVRSVQAALTLTGDYNGLLDGKWGRRSQSSLEDYVARQTGNRFPTFSDLAPLVREFDLEVSSGGWTTYNSEDGLLSFAMPAMLLNPPTQSDNHITMETPSRDLLIRLLFDDLRGTSDMHLWLRRNHVGREDLYTFDGRDRLISAGELSDGKHVYLWSARSNIEFASVLIQWEPRQQGRANLVAASLKTGPALEIYLPSTAVLRRLMEDDRAFAAAAPPQPEPGVEPGPEAPAGGTGTAFYISPLLLTTAAHVIEGCGKVSLTDGTILTVRASDEALDLALLESPEGSRSWLSLTDAAVPQLGEPVFALGFPFLGLFDQGLSVTGGNVSALPNSAVTGRLTISAPVQPGNSGGPLMNRGGLVIGVVVSRLNALKMLEATGSLSENMNFAVPPAALTAFLRSSGVEFDDAAGVVANLSEGVPKAIQEAVVPIFCD